MAKFGRSYIFLILAILLGIATGVSRQETLLKGAETISSLFMNFLQLLACPIVFLSILASLLGMRGASEMRGLGKRIFGYTILTTVAATLIALTLFLIIDPVNALLQHTEAVAPVLSEGSYLCFFLKIIPSNFIQAFLDNNVIGIAFLATVLGFAALSLPQKNREVLSDLFSSLFKLLLKTTSLVISFMPLAIWAFTALLVEELRQGSSQWRGLSLYLGVVLGANLVQGFVVLPLLLKAKGISPLKTAKGAVRALVMAFFSKSSNATLPITLQCAENQLGIRSRIAHFSLPLCTVINMNGCAAFILTTVLFVAGVNGHVFAPLDLGLWVVLAVIAAVGNAGVPMGCFFLSSAFLVAMDVPVKVMGLILPFYAFLDMVETALNVWSDICVTCILDKEVKRLDEQEPVSERSEQVFKV